MLDARSNHHLVVCYGHDRSLLATRLLLLESANATVSPVLTEAQFRVEVCRLLPQVVVLCQSLTAEQCLRAADFVSEMSPLTKILVMVNRPGKCQTPREHFELAGAGPREFVKKVEDLIEASSRSKAAQISERSVRLTGTIGV